MKLKIFLLLLVTALAIPQKTFPTCIVIIRDRHGNIYLAADSKAIYLDYKSKSVCKIKRVGKFYFAFAGYDLSLADTVAKRVFVKNKPTHDLINEFAVDLAHNYDIKLNQNHELPNWLIDSINAHNSPIAEVAIFYFEGGKTHIDELRPIVANSQLKYLRGYDRNSSFLGIDKDLNNNNPRFIKLLKTEINLSKLTKKMVELQMSLDTFDIAKPIDQLIMDSTGKIHLITKRCPI
jgi:hypothetical protein